MTTAEKYAEIGGRENAPLCACHGEVMLWEAPSRWRCAEKRREVRRRYEASEKGREVYRKYYAANADKPDFRLRRAIAVAKHRNMKADKRDAKKIEAILDRYPDLKELVLSGTTS